MIIGRKNYRRRGCWSFGIEFSMRHPVRRDWSPRLEIFCFKILNYPRFGEMIDKKRDIWGFFKMWWIERNIVVYARQDRKGFRKGKGPMVPVNKSHYKLLSW